MLIISFLASLAVLQAAPTDINVASFTCNDGYAVSTEPVAVGQSVYGDTDVTWKSHTNMKDLSNTYIIQTASIDASFVKEPVATATNESPQSIQYLVAIPKTMKNTPPSWLAESNWVLIPGATIVCAGPNGKDVVFVVFQKKYAVNNNPTFGNSGGANNDGMWFALYTPLESHMDIGVSPQDAAPAAAVCTVSGDPHIMDFNNLKMEYGDIDTWDVLLLADDCAFEVQLQSKSSFAPASFVAIRMERDLVTYDFTKKKLEKFIIGDTTVKATGNGYTIENKNVGLKVYVQQHGHTIKITLSSAYYMENSNGICGVLKRHPFDLPKVPQYDICQDSNAAGESVEKKRHFAKVQPANALWDQKATWTVNSPKATDFCVPHFCMDRTKLRSEDLPIPDYTCSALPVELESTTAYTFEQNDCPIFGEEGACLNIPQDVMEVGYERARTSLACNRYQSECDILMDFCVDYATTGNIPEVQDQPDFIPSKCQMSVENEAHIVQQDGFDYATLDFANPNPVGNDGCHDANFINEDGAQEFAKVPFGWELVPESASSQVDKLLQSYSFGTQCILTARDAPYAVKGPDGTFFTDCQGQSLSFFEEGYEPCMAVTTCPSRILLRRRTYAEFEAKEPAAVGWAANVKGSTLKPVCGNRGYTQKSIGEWAEHAMTSDKTSRGRKVMSLAKEGNLVVNFARNADTNEVHLCFCGAKITAVLEIETTPRYPITWNVQQRRDLDSYTPLLNGAKLTSTHVFGDEPHASCVGPLLLSSQACLRFTVKEGTGKVHVVGPQDDGSFGSSAEFELQEELSIDFCPVAVENAFSATCAATA